MIVNITEDKIFKEGDDGVLHRVMDACCLVIPLDTTWKFQLEDRLYVMRLTSNKVEIKGEVSGEDSVTINSTGAKINQINKGALFVKVGENEWDEIFGNMV